MFKNMVKIVAAVALLAACSEQESTSAQQAANLTIVSAQNGTVSEFVVENAVTPEELQKGAIESGKEYIITYVIDEKGLNDAVGLELVTTYAGQDGKQHVYSVEPFDVIKKDGNLYTFQAKHKLENAGSFKVAYRMFPKNADLPHRQDFCYVRWFI